jgi:glycosyltransferase involved in cell wall biosynthesis
MIPRIAHFVYGLREQDEPFHFLHYVAIESCRRVLAPDAIYFHHKHRPWGRWWSLIRPHLLLLEVDQAAEVAAAEYRPELVPPEYRYAHHADFVRLDVLIEHGGIYADIDTIFLRPLPAELYDAPFVIGRESPVRDELSRELRPSLCNALLMAEPGATFARAWRAQMADALNGTWTNHSGFLSERLSRDLPAEVRIVPETSFFSFRSDPDGLVSLLERRAPVAAEALSVHLWGHLWWDRRRLDFSRAHAGWYVPPLVRWAPTTLADLARPYLPERSSPAARTASRRPHPRRWRYISLDENSGYGIAAQRCIEALEQFGAQIEWEPFVPGPGLGLGYEPAFGAPHPRPLDGRIGVKETSPRGRDGPEVVIAHVVPEYLPHLRARDPDAFLVAHTVWDTDRIPGHWVACLNQADLIVVPSQFAADAIAGSAVRAPVEVVPHAAVSVALERSRSTLALPDEVLVFYTIGEFTERKGITSTVEAYLRAFTARDRVALIVKTSQRDMRVASAEGQVAARGTSAWSLAQLLAKHPDPPAMKVITREISDAEIAALHRRGDCYVSLCRSEGFGLGAFDAATYGKPVVITGFSAPREFLGDSPYLVRFELVPVVDLAGAPSYTPDQRWAEPDIDHGAALLRAVAARHREAAAHARALAKIVRRRHAPQAVAARFCRAVERHGGSRARAASVRAR